MGLLHPHILEELVITSLVDGERHTHELLNEVRTLRPATTKQGFYAALRKLRKKEIVVVYKKSVSINTTWLRDMGKLLERMDRAYGKGVGADTLSLGIGESVSYVFSNTTHLDTYWGHAQNLLLQRTGEGEAIYAYDPHYWFFVARQSTEQKLLTEVTSRGRQFLMTVGGESPLDLSIRSKFNTHELQYHTEKVFAEREYYVTVIDNYVTEVFLDPRLARVIDEIYEQSIQPGEAAAKLKALLSVRTRNRIRISHAPAKARRLKKRLGKNFFIKGGAAKSS